MQAEIETLEHVTGGGWWLRFRSRSTPTFVATREKLKAHIPYPDRLWVPEACNGRGAWFIEEQSLAKLAHLFSNYHFCRWLAEEAERERARATQAEADRRRREEEEAQRQRQQQSAPVLVPTNHHQAFILLGLPESSPRRHIQEAYRQLALKHHPDHGGSHQMMVAINSAYQLALRYAKATPAA